jgi:predicted molibdopterin-dependent oxidoreductase YjgC
MSLHYLPTDANVLGITDMGVAPQQGGKSFPEIIEAAKAGQIKGIVIHDDNPLLNAPCSEDIRAAFEAVDALVVIDSVRSTAAEGADVVLAELPFFSKDGTITTADRRINRQHPAGYARREERQGIELLSQLAVALGAHFNYTAANEVMDEAATQVAGYRPYNRILSGRTRALPEERPAARLRMLSIGEPATSEDSGLQLIVGRSLYTTWEGASMRFEEADKLHREEAAVINPRDAEAAGVRMGDTIVLTDGAHEVRIAVRLDDGVAPGTVYVPHYYDGGAVMSLLPLEGAATEPVRVQVRALQLA